jgi:hypothetical protein
MNRNKIIELTENTKSLRWLEDLAVQLLHWLKKAEAMAIWKDFTG